MFPQFGLCLNKVCLEQHPGMFLFRIGARGTAVFLKLPRFRDDSVVNADGFSLCYSLAR